MSNASPRAPVVRIGTWNTEFAEPGRVRGERVRPILAAPDCDILCVTEGYAETFPDGGHIVTGGDDPGYPIVEGQKKVLLWSKEPWESVEFGPREMPEGRFVAGITRTPIGQLTVVGVCIPWHFAHVNTGCKNRRPWEVHLDWLSSFKRTAFAAASRRTVVLGDFNQRVPRSWTPKVVYAALRRALEGLVLSTCGELPWQNRDARGASAPNAGKGLWKAPLSKLRRGSNKDQLIDHVAHTQDLSLVHTATRHGAERRVGIFPRRTLDGPLSDHFGVWADFTAEAPPTPGVPAAGSSSVRVSDL
ncbi:MAG: endonuclease/exonuclease/phosphatase family protein [Holophagales bacterium]|nr:endonuclease/exonuclease/phosphatase family protein [Holophagales bacterium]MYH26542.1 endonuclease/exonuclease/phosphatase family protein [Holophagales bacterium]